MEYYVIHKIIIESKSDVNDSSVNLIMETKVFKDRLDALVYFTRLLAELDKPKFTKSYTISTPIDKLSDDTKVVLVLMTINGDEIYYQEKDGKTIMIIYKRISIEIDGSQKEIDPISGKVKDLINKWKPLV